MLYNILHTRKIRNTVLIIFSVYSSMNSKINNSAQGNLKGREPQNI